MAGLYTYVLVVARKMQKINNRKHRVPPQQKLSSILSNIVGVKYSCFVNELFTLMSHSALMENEFGFKPAFHQLFSGYT